MYKTNTNQGANQCSLAEEWCTVWLHRHSLLFHFKCYTMPGNLPSEMMLNALAVKVNVFRERNCKRILSCIIENMIGHRLYRATSVGTWGLQRFHVKNSPTLTVSVKGYPCRITAGYMVTWQHQYGPGLPSAVKLLKAVQFLIVGKNFSYCIIIPHPFCFLMVHLLFL